MSTYCGKDCADCNYKEELQCSGCKQGPGRVIDGDCKLARCCRDKGHETCETCLNKRNCGMWLDKGSVARVRKEKAEEEIRNKNECIDTARALVKWVGLLFWMIIPIELFTILKHDKVVELFPMLELPATVASGIMQCVCAWILFQMSKKKDVYKKPSILLAITAVLEMISGLVPEENGWLFLFTLPYFAISLISIYSEFMAHAKVMEPFDSELSENWEKLWKWQLFGLVGFSVSVFVVFIIPIAGGLALIGCTVLIVVASVLKYVYLYRMMKLLETY